MNTKPVAPFASPYPCTASPSHSLYFFLPLVLDKKQQFYWNRDVHEKSTQTTKKNAGQIRITKKSIFKLMAPWLTIANTLQIMAN